MGDHVKFIKKGIQNTASGNTELYKLCGYTGKTNFATSKPLMEMQALILG